MVFRQKMAKAQRIFHKIYHDIFEYFFLVQTENGKNEECPENKGINASVNSNASTVRGSFRVLLRRFLLTLSE